MNLKIFAIVHNLMNYINLIDSFQAHLPVQYATNIELIGQKWYWGVFDNASALSAIECFLSERKRSPRRLQALTIQHDRCFSQNSKMATKIIMGFRGGLWV